LTNAATAGDTITTISFYVSSVLNAIPNSPASVSSSNLAALSTIPSTAGNITVPAVTGTMMVSGNMPAFSAYLSANQSVTNNVATKVALNTEDFDTANCFDSTTNYRFTPNVAGYYQFNLPLVSYSSASNITGITVSLYKNGSQYAYIQNVTSAVVVYSNSMSVIASANGTTDYFEMYAQITGSGLNVAGSSTRQTSFSGSLIRGA
jgi:hypothetical protein